MYASPILPDHQVSWLEQPQHETLVRFADHWSRLATDRQMPDRPMLTPGKIAGYMSHMVIVDNLTPGADPRVRYYGTGLSDFLGEERTNMSLSEFAKGRVQEQRHRTITRWQTAIDETLKTAAPVFGVAEMQDTSRLHYRAHFGTFPFSNGKRDQMEQILAIILPEVITSAAAD